MKFLLIFLILTFQRTTQTTTYLTSDYLVALLEGAKIDQYVDGSLTCAYLLRDSQYDVLELDAYF